MSQQEETQDEITPKEVILKIQESLFVLLFVGYAYLSKPIYNANLTFMLSDDKGGGNGLSALFGQFIGGGGGGKNNLDKLLELSKSRRIIQEVLFDSTRIQGKDTYLANHLIDFYDIHEKWEEDTTGLKNFYFQQDSVEAFTVTENKAFKLLYAKLVGSETRKGLFNGSYGDETNILKFSVKSLNETLSIDLCNSIFESLSHFYVTRTVEKQKKTYDIVKFKMDSISTEIAIKENGLARFKDTSLGLWTNKDKLTQARLQRDLQVLYQMFEVAVKNHEISEHSLKSQIPYIQLIDDPISPIKPEVSSKLSALILGGLAGGILSVFFILARRIYRDIMA